MFTVLANDVECCESNGTLIRFSPRWSTLELDIEINKIRLQWRWQGNHWRWQGNHRCWPDSWPSGSADHPTIYRWAVEVPT